MLFSAPEFEITQESPAGDAALLISVRGEIHVSTAPAFSEALDRAIEGGCESVVLDLEAVEFIDSTGLSVLLNALRRVTRRRGRMALVITNATVLRLFHITRLDSTFAIYPDRAQALAATQPDADDSTSGAP